MTDSEKLKDQARLRMAKKRNKDRNIPGEGVTQGAESVTVLDDPTPAECLATFCQPDGRDCPSRCYILHRTVLTDPGVGREWSVLA